ncbi:MAG: hypothetical protein ACE5DI_03925 [Candidatus Micrarchaeia archaeon]
MVLVLALEDFALLAGYYAFFLVGSVSFGYLVLRFSYPDVRLFAEKEKMGASALIGAAMVVVAALGDYGLSLSFDYFVAGFFPLILGFLLVFAYLASSLYFHFFGSQYLTVGIPVPSVPVGGVKPLEQPALEKSSLASVVQQVRKTVASPVKPVVDAHKAGGAIEGKPLAHLKGESSGSVFGRLFALAKGKQKALKPVEKKPVVEKAGLAVPFKQNVSKPGAPPWVKLESLKKAPTPLPSLKRGAEKKVDITVPFKSGDDGQQEKKVEKPSLQKPAVSPVPSEPVEKPVALKTAVPSEGVKEEKLKSIKEEIGGTGQVVELNVPLKREPFFGSQTGEFSVRASKEEMLALKKKVKKTEMDAIIGDLVPEDKEEKSVAVSKVPQPKRRRRRYLMHGRNSVKVIASKDVAQKEEFNSLVQDVYSELEKSQTSDSLAEAVKVKKPGDITMEDLFGKKKEEKTLGFSAKEEGVFGKLAEISDEKKTRPVEEKQEKKVELVKIQAEKGMGCPGCHSKNTRIVFCPYCGTGMCANCAPKITPRADHFVYVCPKCLEDVTVKKKAPVSPKSPV